MKTKKIVLNIIKYVLVILGSYFTGTGDIPVI